MIMFVGASSLTLSRTHWMHADAQDLPFAPSMFDLVVCQFGVMFFPDKPKAYGEAKRVLRSGGHVAFSFWADSSENIAWGLVFDAIARCGDPAASQAPQPGGGFGTAAQCADALAGAGFADCTTRLVRATWRHTNARAMVSALQAGTARMAAMIEAQTAAAMPAIVADIEEHAARYRDTDGIAVPIAAVIAAGVKR